MISSFEDKSCGSGRRIPLFFVFHPSVEPSHTCTAMLWGDHTTLVQWPCSIEPKNYWLDAVGKKCFEDTYFSHQMQGRIHRQRNTRFLEIKEFIASMQSWVLSSQGELTKVPFANLYTICTHLANLTWFRRRSWNWLCRLRLIAGLVTAHPCKCLKSDW